MPAGSITFAGLNMAEFAQNPTGHNRHHGDCHNPWNLPYITGGSSSGSGAAVAAGFAYGALGSDTGGVDPVAGGGVRGGGAEADADAGEPGGGDAAVAFGGQCGAADAHGAGCARIMGVIAGADPADPTCATEAVPEYEAALTGDLAGMRVGLVGNAGLMGRDGAVVDAVAAAARVLAGRGGGGGAGELPHMDAVAAYVGDRLAVRGGGDPCALDAGAAAGLCGAPEFARCMRDMRSRRHITWRRFRRGGRCCGRSVREVFGRGRDRAADDPDGACRPWPRRIWTWGRRERSRRSGRSRQIRGRSTTWACRRPA